MEEAPGFPEFPFVLASQDPSQHDSSAKPNVLQGQTCVLSLAEAKFHRPKKHKYGGVGVVQRSQLTISKMMPSNDQYPNHQSHDQMLAGNADPQTC